jgi:hypothetical protein
VAEPFLDFGEVRIMVEGVGRGRGPQGMGSYLDTERGVVILSMANCQIWQKCLGSGSAGNMAGVRDFLILFVHLIVTVARLARPGGLRSAVAESVLVRHQLLVLNCGRACA